MDITQEKNVHRFSFLKESYFTTHLQTKQQIHLSRSLALEHRDGRDHGLTGTVTNLRTGNV